MLKILSFLFFYFLLPPLILFNIVSNNAQAQGLAFPFKAEDLSAGVRLSTGDHGGGIQTQGKDIVARRYAGNDLWFWNTEDAPTVPSDESPIENRHRVIYGMPFYAMADGEVIGCWRNAPENPGPNQTHPERLAGRVIGGGNHLWIRHDDGTVALYAHAIPDTIPESLCPNEAVLTPRPPATCPAPSTSQPNNPDVDPCAYVPAGVPPTTPSGPNIRRPRVTRGQFIGKVGNSGQSSQPHLHAHLESGFTGTSRALGMTFERGLWSPRSGSSKNIADINDWRSFSGSALPDRDVLVWPPRSLGAEYSRHGFDGRVFQRMFDHLDNSGYMPEVLDCYGVGGRLFFNMVWRPSRGSWRAFAGVNESRYQRAIHDASSDNFTPVFVDSCSSSGGTRYVAIFRQNQGPSAARHRLSKAEHIAFMEEMKRIRMMPVSISVVSRGAQRDFTVLYRPNTSGRWRLRTKLRRDASGDQYQMAVDDAKEDGLKPVYVNAYLHNGRRHFAAIFAERPTGDWAARHDRNRDEYQAAWGSMIGNGFLTRSVTAFDGANQRHVFAGVWIKP
jgi:hypothetical protein